MKQIFTLTKKIILGTIFSLMMLGFYINCYAVDESGLPYSEGGPVIEDPGLQTTDSCLYIDSENGDDGFTGAKDQPWKTLGAALTALESLPDGTHILLKRGGIWSEVWEANTIEGTDGKRYVLGAYGPLTDPKPQITAPTGVRIRFCSYWMVRDLDVTTILFFKTDNSIIFNNTVHNWAANGIDISGGTHHIAIVQNMLYDGPKKDIIIIHDSSSKPTDDEKYVRDHFWVVDNVVIGNSGVNEAIRVDGLGWRNGYEYPADIKIVSNKIQCKDTASAGGENNRPLNLSSTDKYTWVIGNTFANGIAEGIYVNDPIGDSLVLENLQFSSNIVFTHGEYNTNVYTNGRNITFKHNTLINTNAILDPTVSFKDSTENAVFKHNLLLASAGDNLFSLGEGIVQSPAVDSNWYSPEAPSSMIANDLHSGAGEATGVSLPEDNSYNNNPENWSKYTFLQNFIPSASWAGNNMNVVPGVFKSDNTRQGFYLEPFQGYDNNGYGWEGPLLVQARYPVSEKWDGSVSVGTKQQFIKESLLMNIYPNPSNGGNIFIQYELSGTTDVVLTVHNEAGTTVKTYVNKNQGKGMNTIQIDALDYTPGMYFCKLVAGNKMVVKKFIVQE